MLKFNLTKEAAKHLYPQYKQENIVRIDNAMTLAEDWADCQQREERDTHFVVHAIKIRNSVSLVAMEYESRWVSVIQQVKRGDVDGFINRLQNRLINGVAELCRQSRLITRQDFEKSIGTYLKAQGGICFYLRSDRSCIGHMAQTAQMYKEMVKDIGYPPDDNCGLMFDLEENSMLRSVNHGRDYFWPDRIMTGNYLKRFMGVSDARIQSVIKAMNDDTVSGPEFPDLRVLY